MAKLIDMAGKRFGTLTVLERSDESGTNKGVYWLCRCDCGKEKCIRGADLRDGSISSCGCVKVAKTSIRFRKHGMSNTLLYNIWSSMKARCNRPTCKDYPNYGGRGISVCNEWNDFENFYRWAISHGYQEHLTIERIDADGDYAPSNCTWIENEKQALNRRNTVKIQFDGKQYTVRELSVKLGIKYNTARAYISQGKPVQKLLEVRPHA